MHLTALAKVALLALSCLLPWSVRRWLLVRCFAYEIHPTARIGFSLVAPRKLIMEADSRIGHLTVCKGLSRLHLGKNAILGSLNWVTGFPEGHAVHFAAETERRPELRIEEHAAVTNRHLIDCTDQVLVGRFSTVAGFRSQVITHSIDLEGCRQSCAPIEIGEYCFVGTGCVLLKGSGLPAYSVLAANSTLTKHHVETWRIYGGVPARMVKEIPRTYRYFTRSRGFVD